MSPSPRAMAASIRCSRATSALLRSRPAARCGFSRSRTERGAHVTERVTLLTAAIFAAVAAALITLIPAAAQQTSAIDLQGLADQGKVTYAKNCSHCHGPNMVNSGTITPDLRAFPDDK